MGTASFVEELRKAICESYPSLDRDTTMMAYIIMMYDGVYVPNFLSREDWDLIDNPKGTYGNLMDRVRKKFNVRYDSTYDRFGPKSYLDVAIHLFEKNPGAFRVLKDYYKVEKFHHGKKFDEMCRVLELPRNHKSGDYLEVEELDCCNLINYALANDTHALDAFMAGCDWEDLQDGLSWALYLKFIYNAPLGNLLARAESFIGGNGRIEPAERDMLLDYVVLYRYIYEGSEVEIGADRKGPWAAVYHAIRRMYGGDIDGALDSFKSSFKDFNLWTDNYKNCVPDIILNHFYILCLKKADTPDSRKRVDQFLRKKLSEDNLYSFSKATALMLGDMSVDYADCLYSLREDLYRTEMAKILAMMLANSSGAGDYLRNSYDTDAVPAPAIIRHELSAIKPSPDEAALSLLYGGPSLIGNMKFKDEWEISLEKALGLVDKNPPPSGGGPKAAAESRIVYIISLKDKTFEINLQKSRKNGDWGTMSKMSARKFRDDASLPKTPQDLALAAKLPDTRDTSHPLYDLISEMVGSDRVFVLAEEKGGESHLLPVTIYEDKPGISVEKDKDKNVFVISSSCNTFGGEGGKTVLYQDATHYSVITTTPLQDKILSAIVGYSVPVGREDFLRQSLPRFAPFLDINSSLIEGGTTKARLDGDAKIVLRMTPTRDDVFILDIFVRPLAGGKKTFVPGKGSRKISDDVSGKGYQVSRDLEAEKKNASLLYDFMEQTLDFDLGDGREAADGPYELEPHDVLDLLDFASSNTGSVAVEWKEGKKIVLRGTLAPRNITINLRSKENWFEMEGKVTLPGGSVIELAKLLGALSQGQENDGYVLLGEAGYVKITDALRRQLRKLEAMTQQSRGKEKISVFQVGQLAELVRGQEDGMDVKVDKGIRDLMDKINRSASLKVKVPSELRATLRDYQVDGFEWMVRLDSWGGGACLADDMGLGKTVQTIAFLLHKKADGPALVVAPASVLYNWQNELQRFAPSLGVSILNTSADRRALIEGAGPGDVLLSTYGILVSEEEPLCLKKWNVVCLDEAHVIKNRDTKMSAAAMKLTARSRLILTGTPVQNYLGELWNLFQFLNPGLLGTYEQFRTKYIVPIESLSDKERQRQLRRVVQPFMLRRTKAEVVSELPDKVDITREVMLSTEETLNYEKIREEAKNLIENQKKVDVVALSMITKLRQASCSMALVEDSWDGSESKVTAFMDLVTEITSSGNRALVFSQFTSFLSICRQSLEGAGIPYFYLDGSTPIKKREEMVAAFQNGEMSLFLISLKAGGLGLNLTGANYVIHLDPWWNPAAEQQATDRAYRIGQENNVTVYHLISSHTIEEKIVRLHKVKRDMADAILEGSNVSHALTLDDLRDLVDI